MIFGGGTGWSVYLEDAVDLAAWRSTPTFGIRDGAMFPISPIPSMEEWLALSNAGPDDGGLGSFMAFANMRD